MEQQLRILTNPSDSTKTVESLNLPPQWLDGSPYTITDAEMYAYDAGQLIASGTLTGGTLFLVSSDNNSLRYDWTNTEIDYLSQAPKAHYQSVWILNATKRTEYWFSVNYWKLENPIDEQDLLLEKPELAQFRPEKTLTMTAVSSGAACFCNQISEPSGYYDGSVILFNGGNLMGREFRVQTWDAQTKSFILTENIGTLVKQGDKFILKRSFKPEITRAWEEIMNKVQTWTPLLIAETRRFLAFPFVLFQTNPNNRDTYWGVDGNDFRELLLFKSMMKICSNLSYRDKDRFESWNKEYGDYYETSMASLKIKVDANRDGIYGQEDTTERGTRWFNH